MAASITFPNRILNLIRGGQKDQAVQLYQESFKVSSEEAMNAVSELERLDKRETELFMLDKLKKPIQVQEITCPGCGKSMPVSYEATREICPRCQVWVNVPNERNPFTGLSSQQIQDKLLGLLRTNLKAQAAQRYKEGFEVSYEEAWNAMIELEGLDQREIELLKHEDSKKSNPIQKIACPNCGQSLSVAYGATREACPHCQVWVDVPAEQPPLSSLPAEKIQEKVIGLLRSGQKDQAVQLYQESLKVSAVEARFCVDQMERDAKGEADLAEGDYQVTKKYLRLNMPSDIAESVYSELHPKKWTPS